MGWQVVAEGTNIWSLKQTVGNIELPKGARMRVVFRTSMPWLFDIAGAEQIFGAFKPDGMDIVDVWGEDNDGIVEMEADPAWLTPVLGFIGKHWMALIIGGFLLWTVVSFIWVMVKLPAIATFPITLILGAAAGILLLAYLSRLPRAPPKKE